MILVYIQLEAGPFLVGRSGGGFATDAKAPRLNMMSIG
jgi:hypothetical protein